jgi:hypothetical protein
MVATQPQLQPALLRLSAIISQYFTLLVESPIMNQRLKLPIVHRDDFILAASVFDEPEIAKVVENEELLVTYAPKHMLPDGAWLAPPLKNSGSARKKLLQKNSRRSQILVARGVG